MINLLKAMTEDTIHEGVLEHWRKAKATKLAPLFGDDKLIIEKDVVLTLSQHDLERELRNSRIVTQIVDNIGYHDLVDKFRAVGYGEGYYAMSELVSISSLLAGRIQKNYRFIHPATKKEVSLQSGMKIMRAIGLFSNDKDKLAEIQTLYSQIMNQKTVRGTLCLSIHPADYMSASYNDSGWSSCFNSVDGAYRASLTGLLASENTMIAYLKAKDDMTFWNNPDVTWNSKKWRAFVTLDETNNSFHIGRNYPYTSFDLMNEVRGMVAELTQKQYLSDICEHPEFFGVTTPCNFYNDASRNKGIYAYTTETFDRTQKKTVSIGTHHICVECGDLYTENRGETMRCQNCDNAAYCEYCDCYYDADEMYEVDGMLVCHCCYHDCTYTCDGCGATTMDSNQYAIYKDSDWRSAPVFEYVCDGCFYDGINSGRYIRLEDYSCRAYLNPDYNEEDQEE